MKVVVLELNEIPKKLFDDFVEDNPKSSLAFLIKRSVRYETMAEDVPKKDLYPSQTWASINSGLAYGKHGVRWYNDEKVKCPILWDELAGSGFSVGTVNVVHSSEFERSRQFEYYVPDPYARLERTIPASLSSFQAFKIRQTFKSARVSKLGFDLGDLYSVWKFLPFVSLTTCRVVIDALWSRFKGRRERLRNVEFSLHADIFLNRLSRSPASVNVLFTNHIASQMHRYLGAKYPTQRVISNLGEDWVGKFKDEVDQSVALLDRYLGRVLDRLDLEHDCIVLVSSMGQEVVEDYSSSYLTKFVGDPALFWEAVLPKEIEYEIVGAMVPQLSLRLPDEEAAQDLGNLLGSYQFEGITIKGIRVAGNMVTASALFPGKSQTCTIHGASKTLAEIGVKVDHVDTQNTGRHSPEGILWASGKHGLGQPGHIGKICYLDYKELMLKVVNEVCS